MERSGQAPPDGKRVRPLEAPNRNATAPSAPARTGISTHTDKAGSVVRRIAQPCSAPEEQRRASSPPTRRSSLQPSESNRQTQSHARKQTSSHVAALPVRTYPNGPAGRTASAASEPIRQSLYKRFKPGIRLRKDKNTRRSDPYIAPAGGCDFLPGATVCRLAYRRENRPTSSSLVRESSDVPVLPPAAVESGRGLPQPQAAHSGSFASGSCRSRPPGNATRRTSSRYIL